VKIGDLARQAGIRPSAIRYYESAGLFPVAERRGGQRVYGADALRRLELLKAGQMLGFSLEEVAMVLGSIGEPSVTARWKTLAARKIAELDQAIATARAIKGLLEEGLQCGCVDASECLLKLRKRSPGDARGQGKLPRRRAT
jgi:MerR family transcriptional regulator, redox-sensitive transcriptional activator SoxR